MNQFDDLWDTLLFLSISKSLLYDTTQVFRRPLTRSIPLFIMASQISIVGSVFGVPQMKSVPRLVHIVDHLFRRCSILMIAIDSIPITPIREIVKCVCKTFSNSRDPFWTEAFCIPKCAVHYLAVRVLFLIMLT